MIKVDLHMHSGEDPKDGLRYPATALVDKAAELGFGAIAITLHNRVLDDERVFDYARQKGLLLIRGVEWGSDWGDVLLYNVTQRELDRLRTLADLRAFRRDRGDDLLVIAAHPYFFKHSLHRHFERNLDLFDAVEYCHMHFPWLNLNRRGVRIAEQHGKAVVATSDAHNLWMFGRTTRSWMPRRRKHPSSAPSANVASRGTAPISQSGIACGCSCSTRFVSGALARLSKVSPVSPRNRAPVVSDHARP